MKKIHDIEQMSLQELETIAEDRRIAVPEEIQEQVETIIEAQALRKQREQGRKGNYLRPLSIALAAAVACLIVVFTLPKKQAELQDTFDDPRLAYAELEQIFNKLSTTMEKGITLASNSKTNIANTIDNTYKIK